MKKKKKENETAKQAKEMKAEKAKELMTQPRADGDIPRDADVPYPVELSSCKASSLLLRVWLNTPQGE